MRSISLSPTQAIETQTQHNVVSCYKEAVQFRASFVTSLLPLFGKIYEMAMNFVFFFVQVIKIKIANTPLDRLAAVCALGLCVIN